MIFTAHSVTLRVSKPSASSDAPSNIISTFVPSTGWNAAASPAIPAITPRIRISHHVDSPNLFASSDIWTLKNPSDATAMPRIRHMKSIARPGFVKSISPSATRRMPIARSY